MDSTLVLQNPLFKRRKHPLTQAKKSPVEGSELTEDAEYLLITNYSSRPTELVYLS